MSARNSSKLECYIIRIFVVFACVKPIDNQTVQCSAGKSIGLPVSASNEKLHQFYYSDLGQGIVRRRRPGNIFGTSRSPSPSSTTTGSNAYYAKTRPTNSGERLTDRRRPQPNPVEPRNFTWCAAATAAPLSSSSPPSSYI